MPGWYFINSSEIMQFLEALENLGDLNSLIEGSDSGLVEILLISKLKDFFAEKDFLVDEVFSKLDERFHKTELFF